MATAISVARLSKQYRIGLLRHETMIREVVTAAFKGRFPRRDRDSEKFWALKDASFEVAQGEVVGIVGRNGAGKSTLLKLLSKITYPTSGSARVRGRVASLLEVGTGFHEELTGRENVYLNGSILGMRSAEINAKLDAIVDFSGVEQFIDTSIKRYSSGMRLRLGFAVAAHLDPDVLIIDEILAVGDAAFQRKCLDTMNEFQSGGRTVLFVSHNMQAIENLCPRTIWIENGRIHQDGRSENVVREYLGSFGPAQNGGLDFREYENRRGNGEATITRAEFLTRDGQTKDVIRSGDDLVVRIHYHAQKAIRQPHFGFRLLTNMGTMVTDMSTWSTGLDIPEIEPGDASIDFEIDFLNLMPDRYYLTLWIQGTGPVFYDILDNCSTFNVEPSNYNRSGRGISNKFGLVFFQGRWHPPQRQ